MATNRQSILNVIPAKAGIHAVIGNFDVWRTMVNLQRVSCPVATIEQVEGRLGSRLRGNDGRVEMFL